MNYFFLALFFLTALGALVSLGQIVAVLCGKARFQDWGMTLNILLVAFLGTLAAWFFTLI